MNGKHLGVLAFVLVTAVFAAGGRSTARAPWAPMAQAMIPAPPAAEQVPDQVVVQFAAWVDLAAQQLVAEAVGGQLEDSVGPGLALLRVDAGRVPWIAALVGTLPGVEFAEPNALVHALGTPNDPYFAPFQWNLYDDGVASNGVPSHFGIRAESAWDQSSGAKVVVAVVDTGVAYENYQKFKKAPDLAAARFVAPRNVLAGTSHANDDHGHGTSVAEVIAAGTSNGYGIAGVATACKIMPVKVLDEHGTGTAANSAKGIRWAADHGAQVINLSLGGKTPSRAVKRAVKYAWDKGCVVVAASGNDGVDGVSYPARYPQCIAVGATRFDGRRAPYSNFGADLDLVAPGGDMEVDQNDDGYPDGILVETFSGAPSSFGYFLVAGTSVACPQVAAVAALIKAAHPRFGNAQIRAALESTAIDLGASGADAQFGKGLVNAAAAVSYHP
ncbi:MAG: S8 family serine peptidase [Planctomycetota bacterium]